MIVYGIDSAVVPRAVILTIALFAVLLLLGEKSIPRSRPRLHIHPRIGPAAFALATLVLYVATRSEEHTSELQSLMRISYAVFCLKKKRNATNTKQTLTHTHTNET